MQKARQRCTIDPMDTIGNNSNFQLNIKFGNAVMDNLFDLSKAVEEVAVKIQSGRIAGNVLDINGNTVGEWSIK